MANFNDSSKSGILRRLYKCVREYQWIIVGVILLATLVLGFIGFLKHYDIQGGAASPLDVLYEVIRLFTLESGRVAGPVPWELELARFMAPALVAYTAAKALIAIFFEQYQLFKVRFRRKHVVVCGLGRKGFMLARAFRERGDSVVVIDLDETNSKIELCRDLKAVVLVGNATDSEVLKKARVHRARHLFAVCGSDGDNAEIAVHVKGLVDEHMGGPLSCHIHITDLRLKELMSECPKGGGKGGGAGSKGPASFKHRFINIFERGAYALFYKHQPFGEHSRPDEKRPHMLVVGLGRMGETLVVHSARTWRVLRGKDGGRLRMTIVDRVAGEKVNLLCSRYPQLKDVCEIVPLNMEVRSPEFQEARFLEDDVSSMYICLDNDEIGFTAALMLRKQLKDRDIKIETVVRMTQEAGLARLFDGDIDTAAGEDNMKAFSLLERTCNLSLLYDPEIEIVAMNLHANYLEAMKQDRSVSGPKGSIVPWDGLSEEFKESNRRQAEYAIEKLGLLGYGVDEYERWDKELLRFRDDEVDKIEKMARDEHERWFKERKAQGWKYGKERDDRRKLNPLLVPWAELSDAVQKMNIDQVRCLPVVLAKAGLRVHRPGEM